MNSTDHFLRAATLFLAAAVLTLTATLPASAADLFKRDVTERTPVEVVAQKVTDDGARCEITLKSAAGIFRCRVDGAAATFKSVTLVIRDHPVWEGIELQASETKAIDLLHSPGVQVEKSGNDCVLHFDEAGVMLLKPGGKFQFVDRYR